MKKNLITLILAVICCSIISTCQGVKFPILDNNEEITSSSVKDTPRDRALKLVAQMSQQEKLAMVSGSSGPYVGNTPVNTRLNIPALNLEDGPQGVADGMRDTTAYPSALTVVATWNTSMMYLFGENMAQEQKTKGTNILLGPMVNIARIPYGGRNFESFGEDPTLSSKMVVASVQGIQSQNVMATVKHFVDNNQELNRTLTSANVPKRAQWEIYYPAFQAAVEAGVGAVMCSYNRINDTYACENSQTISDLKDRMGFQGFVMSDWGATHSTVASALAGLDQQMPDNSYFGQALADAITNGQVPQSRLDDMVTRILTAAYAVGIMDTEQPTGNPSDPAMSPSHTAAARAIADEASVLLQNYDNILPITADITKIAVVGDDASVHPIATGGGSGGVITNNLVSPLSGITARAGSSVNVVYANSSNPEIASVVADADIVIVFVATTSSEGSDRSSLSLGNGQDELVNTVATANPNVVVVVHTPGAVMMPWSGEVPAIICAFMPGIVDGDAIADVLFGDVNPSGHLPVTFPMFENEIGLKSVEQYPGIDNDAEYTEELLVGYRWYDAYGYEPRFPFGHGLTYSAFNYSDIHVSGSFPNVTVQFTVTNIGKYDAQAVPQLYLSFPPSAGEPPVVLRDFTKVAIAAGESQTVEFTLDQMDFSIFDVTQDNWVVAKGGFTIFVGDSSRDLRLVSLLVSK
eukprot:TRINITY_DN2471_c0_g1_i2.p1 TRINITY_DN2471_c0_g1~~TRINITY_DN2471_c0_g1_i2.p1  ORF type:complete len:693 (+),score=205.69 TRINITY_DN2471_c0_g1_i2:474-2552(+)